MKNEAIFAMEFSKVYPLLIAKAERKGRTREEVDQVTTWLTGYTAAELDRFLETSISYGAFFEQAPRLNENRRLIKGFCLRRQAGDHRGPADAGDTLSGQAGGRAGQGEGYGKDLAEMR